LQNRGVFIGHYAVALAAKRVEPRVSLGTWILSAEFLDLLWPILLLAGMEHVRIAPGATAMTPLDFYDYPWSHSLVMTLVWSGIVGGIHYGSRHNARAALLVGMCVASHWLLDFATHRPDMPIGLTGPYVGLGLWQSKLATACVEGAMFALGLALYSGATRARDAIGRWSLVAFVAFVLAIYVPQFFAPPPPGETAIAWADMGQWLLVAWAYWIDRHRASRAIEVRTSAALA
jgi:hypothetical protein